MFHGNISLTVPSAISRWYGIHAESAEALVSLRGLDWITLECPCGRAVGFQRVDDVPHMTTPHPCGHPGHFTVFIKEAACSPT